MIHSDGRGFTKRVGRALPWLIVLAGAGLGLTGIRWGLPDRDRVALLGDDPEAIRLQVSTESRKTGSVAIADPESEEADLPRIYRRFFLYSHHPDEMLTLMSLAQMRPSGLDLNPHLFQYGGLYLYPVGALLFAAGKLGILELSPGTTYYLQNPEAFGRFYVAGRLYVADLCAATALLIFYFGRRLADAVSALGGALLFLLSPGALVFGHEFKPHAAAGFFVLLIFYGLFRAITGGNRRWLLVAALSAGGAMAMVPSLALYFPALIAGWLWLPGIGLRRRLAGAAGGILAAVAVFLFFDPYVLLDLDTFLQEARHVGGFHQAGFRSADLGALVRNVFLPGGGWAMVGPAAVGVILLRRTQRRWLLLVAGTFSMVGMLFAYLLGPAASDPQSVRFLFGFLPVLAVIAAAGFRSVRPRAWRAPAVAVAVLVAGMDSAGYLGGFLRDAGNGSTMLEAGQWINANLPPSSSVGVPPSPAPYKTPPFAFARYRLLDSEDGRPEYRIAVGRPLKDPNYSLVFESSGHRTHPGFSFASQPVFVYGRRCQ